MNQLMNDQSGPYTLDKKTTPKSKWGIICLVDGDSDRAMSIMNMEDDSCMATWDTLEEAKHFGRRSVLCQISSVFYIDLENGLLDF
jgi:hypothetical protein